MDVEMITRALGGESNSQQKKRSIIFWNIKRKHIWQTESCHLKIMNVDYVHYSCSGCSVRRLYRKKRGKIDLLSPRNCGCYTGSCVDGWSTNGQCCRRGSGADSMEHGGTCPHFYEWLGTGAPWVEEQQTRNWPNCADHHESAHAPKRLIVLLAPRSGRARQKIRAGSVPPFSNSFRRYWTGVQCGRQIKRNRTKNARRSHIGLVSKLHSVVWQWPVEHVRRGRSGMATGENILHLGGQQ